MVSGSIFLLSSAAGSPVSIEPENGTAAAPATVRTSASSSNGKAIQFGTPYLTRSGAQLRLNNANYRFVGVNAYGLATCESGSGYYTSANLNAFFSQLPPRTLTRMWATSRATTAELDLVVARAEANNQMLIMSLADGANNCNLANKQLNRAWYQSGYQNDYLPWVDTVTARYKNSVSVGMWEIANEPGWGCPGDCGVTKDEMKSFLDTAAARIKSNDPNHLVESGTMGKQIASMMSQADFAYVHSGPNLDVTSMHEYEYEYNGNMGVGSWYPTAKAASDSISKPVIIGEVGAPLNIPTNNTCRNSNITAEAVMESKFDAYFAGGAAGVLAWNWMKQQPSWQASGCGSGQHWFFGPNNAVLTLLRNYPL